MKHFEIDTNSDNEIVSSQNTTAYFPEFNLTLPGKQINSLIYIKPKSSEDFLYIVDLNIKVLFDTDGDVCYDNFENYKISKLNIETHDIQTVELSEILEILNLAMLETIKLIKE